PDTKAPTCTQSNVPDGPAAWSTPRRDRCPVEFASTTPGQPINRPGRANVAPRPATPPRTRKPHNAPHGESVEAPLASIGGALGWLWQGLQMLEQPILGQAGDLLQRPRFLE
ncbi:MAG: hypothetical protein QOH14_1863, partial [Pseudonocardiales bacterium]|nr:hypothetical protein [Pseudonocardiales bacterium]